MKLNPLVRDIVICMMMVAAGIFVWINAPDKRAASQTINLPTLVPESLPDWRGITYDTAGYSDEWQSINELLTRTYKGWAGKEVDFILEYSSDMRRNFSFHFPENCHRSHGNVIEYLEPLTIALPGGKTHTMRLIYIHGLEGSTIPKDRLIAYWLVIDGRPFYKMFRIKLDQILAGLLNRSTEGMLVRIDYGKDLSDTTQDIEDGKEVITRFIQDLYEVINEKVRNKVFGRSLNH